MEGITDTILMVRPKNFGSNPETLADNHFQNAVSSSEEDAVRTKAIEEFDNMVKELRRNDIDVMVIEDTATPIRPDAIFPNNWFSTHSNGCIISYPMMSESRRIERREDVIEKIQSEKGINKRYGFEYLEEEEQYLEGTGSMVIDRDNGIVYAGLSQRTDIRVLEKFAVLFGYKKVIFHPSDQDGKNIYHTNVMMTMGHKYVIVCLSSITLDDEREELLASFKNSGKEIIDISFDQMNAFAGNMLQVKSKLGEPYLVMSSTAYNSLSGAQIDQILSHNKIIKIAIPTIETHGGGGVRCMMAEIFSE